METTDLLSVLEDLGENIDDLEESLEPLLSAALSITTKKLPLLDRAKLYTLLVYSIESLLFSYLRLNGIQAKNHAVFRELTRVKQYFQKIQSAEDGQNPAKPGISLNKQATGRFIKQALAGNDRYDTERAEREAREKLLAARKSRLIQLPALEPVSRVESEVSEEEQEEEMEDGEVEEEDTEMVDTPAEEPDSGNGQVSEEQAFRKPRIKKMIGERTVEPKRKGGRKPRTEVRIAKEMASKGVVSKNLGRQRKDMASKGVVSKS